MKEKETYQKEINEIIQMMKGVKFSEWTIDKYERILISFDHYYQSKNYSIEDAVISYLTEHNINASNPLTKYQSHMIRVLNVFLDYCYNGHFRCAGKYANHISKINNNVEYAYEKILRNFIDHRVTQFDIAVTTQKKYKKNLKEYCEFLYSKGLSIEDSNKEVLDVFIKHVSKNSNTSLYGKMTDLRIFLKYLFEKQILKDDLSNLVPSTNRNRFVHLPSHLSEDEKEKLILSIERESKIGKRNYAMVVIASQLGLRSSDIANLEFDNFDWNNDTINLIMKKTGKQIILPITSDIGNAIIDYVKNGRPESDAPYIFLTHVAPFRVISSSSLATMIKQQVLKADISIKNNTTCGMHLFRHTLASVLLKKGVELSTISEILGHSNTKTTMIYTHIDIESLRQCALEVMPFIWEGDDFNE